MIRNICIVFWDNFCIFRTWQHRRAAWTNTSLFLCRVGDNSIMDTIPLSDIEKIAGNKYASPHAQNKKEYNILDFLRWRGSKQNQLDSTLQLPIEKISAENGTFFIRTRVGGGNAGRTYSLRICSQICPDIMVSLRRMSKMARTAADSKSRYQILQEDVRHIVDSQKFQCFAAALIFMVGYGFSCK
jgi:hypothetical protein